MAKVPIPAVRLHAPKIKAPKLQAPSLPRRNGSAPGRKQNDALDRLDRELIAERDRLLEKFTVMQADLGGAFYEMAIRDHVKMDVLTRKAAELQRIDIELGEIEEALQIRRADSTGACVQCGAELDPDARFCSQCGTEASKG